ncbi:hypothetical protein [Okeania sp. SIO1I7]|nr:hypothetical protein [Okeania sp. SIO1I7]NET25285.1 hypothetical protein [Okeania sp. SIO1I7]
MCISSLSSKRIEACGEDKLQTAVGGLLCLRSIASAKQEASSKAHAIVYG